MFKTREAVFYRVRLVVLEPIKNMLRVFWTASKTFLEKRVSREVITMMLLWTLEISIREKQTLNANNEEVLSGFKTTHVMFHRPFDRSIRLTNYECLKARWVAMVWLFFFLSDFYWLLQPPCEFATVLKYTVIYWWFIAWLTDWLIDSFPSPFLSIHAI